MSRHLFFRTAAMSAVAALSLTACSVDTGSGATSAASASGSSSTATVKVTGPDSVPKVDEGKPLSVAFFGFAKANSYTAAVYAGVETTSKAHNATATFFDPNFDAQTQVSQLQDAVTSGKYDVFVLLANDGTAVVPAVESALAAGKKVVVLFSPVGTRYDTAQAQVPGTINLVDPPVDNGKILGDLGLQACKKSGANPCKVAYLEGFKSLPLDNARTEAVKKALTDGGAQVVMSVEGGYTNDGGRQAMQDILQAQPDVNVVIGSSQAIAGAAGVAGGASKILFVGNGASRQAYDAVKSGAWFGTVCTQVTESGEVATLLGLAAARGAQVPDSTPYVDLSPVGNSCTAENIGQVTSTYDE